MPLSIRSPTPSGPLNRGRRSAAPRLPAVAPSPDSAGSAGGNVRSAATPMFCTTACSGPNVARTVVVRVRLSARVAVDASSAIRRPSMPRPCQDRCTGYSAASAAAPDRCSPPRIDQASPRSRPTRSPSAGSSLASRPSPSPARTTSSARPARMLSSTSSRPAPRLARPPMTSCSMARWVPPGEPRIQPGCPAGAIRATSAAHFSTAASPLNVTPALLIASAGPAPLSSVATVHFPMAPSRRASPVGARITVNRPSQLARPRVTPMPKVGLQGASPAPGGGVPSGVRRPLNRSRSRLSARRRPASPWSGPRSGRTPWSASRPRARSARASRGSSRADSSATPSGVSRPCGAYRWVK
ncbi:hypothetical protein B0E53_05248 [Micromonospora sp. MH33]|nr:hypothetical protein B0E53_05248 [Micromonospora sp. MH33]